MKKFGLIALTLCTTIQLLAQSEGTLFTEFELKQIHKQQIRLIICDSLNQVLSTQNEILNNQVLINQETVDKLKHNQELTEIENIALVNEVSGQDKHIRQLNRKIKLLKIGMIGVGGIAVLVAARYLIVPI